MKIATVTSNGLNLRTHPTAASKVMTVLTHGDKLEVHKVTADRWQFGWVLYTRQGDDIDKAGWFNQEYVAFSEIPDRKIPDTHFPPLPDFEPGKLLRKEEWLWYFVSVALLALAMSAFFLF